MTPKVLWEVVRHAAKAAEIERLAPHDLRRYAVNDKLESNLEASFPASASGPDCLSLAELSPRFRRVDPVDWPRR